MGKFSSIRHLLIGGLAATGLSISGAHAADNVFWNFGTGTSGPIGDTTVVDSVPLGIPITASGFAGNPGTPTTLDRKELGGDEQGLGLTNDPSGENEITPGNFIQLDLSALAGAPLLNLDLSFTPDSTTPPDEWALFLSNTAGAHGAVAALTGVTEATAFIDTAGFRYLDVSALAGNILLSQLDASAVPETPTWTMLLAGFAGLGFVCYRRRRSAVSIV
jgi:hypothetical protein